MKGLLVLALAAVAAGHGSVTIPAMRNNPTVPWCPWCQGEQHYCDPTDIHSCIPPSPCWGASPGETVSPDKWAGKQDLKAPDGTPWIDPTGGTGKVTTWCPGTTVPIRFYINADHNGIVRWESQLASPGAETEEGFQNFTEWVSFNNDPATNYYTTDLEKLQLDTCVSEGLSWGPRVGHCRDEVFAETTLTLPADMPAGQTVFRWIWYGAMNINGTPVIGDPSPEHSLFANCVDIVVGTPEQCGNLEPTVV